MKEKAFPSKEIDWRESQIQERTVYQDQHLGMDLRLYIATKIAQGMTSRMTHKSQWTLRDTEDAFKVADSLIKYSEQ